MYSDFCTNKYRYAVSFCCLQFPSDRIQAEREQLGTQGISMWKPLVKLDALWCVSPCSVLTDILVFHSPVSLATTFPINLGKRYRENISFSQRWPTESFVHQLMPYLDFSSLDDCLDTPFCQSTGCRLFRYSSLSLCAAHPASGRVHQGAGQLVSVGKTWTTCRSFWDEWLVSGFRFRMLPVSIGEMSSLPQTTMVSLDLCLLWSETPRNTLIERVCLLPPEIRNTVWAWCAPVAFLVDNLCCSVIG